MTYDIVFIHRSLGQAFDSAIAEAFNGEPASEQLRDSWYDRLQPVMRHSFGDVAVAKSSGQREISDPASGLRLVLKGSGVVMEVPEGPAGVPDPELVQRAHVLAKEIERVTGLEGWDTRLGKTTASMGGLATSGLLAPPPASPPPAAEQPVRAEPIEEPEEEARPARRRWWRFGR